MTVTANERMRAEELFLARLSPYEAYFSIGPIEHKEKV
jgi:hypothetical protein